MLLSMILSLLKNTPFSTITVRRQTGIAIAHAEILSGIAFGQVFGHYGLDQETIEWQPAGSPPHNHASRSCAQIMRT